MQKLEERNTYTPTDIPHIRSNCDRRLNREETLSVSGLKTSSNISDAALTANLTSWGQGVENSPSVREGMNRTPCN